MRIRNLILDWSGTLVDDLRPVWATTNHVLTKCGQPAITLDEFRREFCLPVRKFYAARVPQLTIPELERLFLAEYAQHQDEIQVLPHTREFLEFCQRDGWPVFMASTVDPGTYHRQMKRFGLDPFVTQSYIGIEDKTVKIHHILEENRLDPAVTLFVGDMEHDIEAGKAGGVHTCAVLSGYNHADRLRAMQPDLICQHVGELGKILAGATHG
jgi:phosphoglycolate phosphatase